MTIRRGDILWADLGMFPTTSVQGGVRPVIVVSNNKANTYSSVITVVPLTSRIYKKRYLPTHVFISKYDMTGIRKGSLALAESVTGNYTGSMLVGHAAGSGVEAPVAVNTPKFIYSRYFSLLSFADS